MVAKPCKHDKGHGPSPQRPQYPNIYRCLKQRLGRSLRASLHKRSVVRQGKKATHKYPRIEASVFGPQKVQGPMPKSNCAGFYGQFNRCSLHNQTRRNPLSRDVCSPVVNHDLVPSLPDNSNSQAHSRVPECDDRPATSQGDKKIRQCNCLIIVIAPAWPGMPWFWDLVQLSTEIPLQLPVSTTILKQSHYQVFHNNPQHLNLHAWCLGVDSSKNKAEVAERIAAPQRSSTRTIYKSKWALFERWCRENLVDFSTPSVRHFHGSVSRS